MPNLVPFSFDNTPIRVVTDERGEPWFVAADVAAILDYRAASDMTRMLGEDEKGTQIVSTLGGPQEATIISESGLYACILKSRKPDAQRFRKWVTAEVLPSLRKTGAYMVVPAAASAVQPSLEFKALYEVATLIGLDQNVAAISANQAVVKLTGTNVLNLLGHEHLIAADQSSLFYTPTELGQRIGVRF